MKAVPAMVASTSAPNPIQLAAFMRADLVSFRMLLRTPR
jgi:hypothetical protein